ncbi:gephyrin-like molybdotransferase receptor GlpR [Corynebacterium frankenforstense]|uniref:divisome protein SepX/GlpR n=1 Tax=Corynebacterium frankenforstense TaxID=1230998 RepID=UPI000A7950C5|nr:gephyrin-like molybdotransferase receptor GlpR [Corynebacterium frankenforstense]
MSGGIVLVLVIVLWLFVLAPLWLRGQKPIRKAGEAFDETRVVYEGGTELPRAARGPRVGAADVREARGEDADEDYEIVSADAADEENVDDVLIDEREEKDDHATSDEVIDGDVVRELEAGDTVTEPVAEADDGELPEAEPAPGDEDTYELAETFTSPEDLLYPDATRRTRGEAIRVVRDEEAAGDAADSDADADADDNSDIADAGSEVAATATAAGTDRVDDESSLADAAEELTEEELEFAASRRGRGGWDPEADERHSLDRYQRRRRTLYALAGVVVATLILGVIAGGWVWLAPVLAVALTAAYLVALRSQVRQEQALRARRIRQLRRARLGVRHRDDEALAIPRALRRPGAIVVELDDESPDFSTLRTVESPFGHGGDDEPRAGSYRDRVAG